MSFDLKFSATAVEEWLKERLSELTGTPARFVDVDERFNRYQLDSVRLVRLLAELEAELGRQLRPTMMWENPTIRSLAQAVSGAVQPEEPRPAPAPTTRGISTDDPIAVVGMSCRFPGAGDLDAYWSLLSNGVDAITSAPPRRWHADTAQVETSAVDGRADGWRGGFLDQVDGFDPQFFGISPREAAEMDPQQRLAMELSWEALDDAGIAPHSLRDTRTAVFFGAMWHDYAQLAAGDIAGITQHTATGQDLSIIPARVSYFLGLRGPAITLNTACSSALVAIHQARQSLLLGESSLALVGGVNLILALDSMVAMERFGAMAPDGRCKAFDSRANGYVRGEGGGVVVLKPLSRALADGNPVYCVIRGSAINNDGFSNGMTAPSPAAQVDVLRDAYANAGIDPAHVDYVEAHGTGTMLGDPIEAGALGTVLGAGRPADRPLVLGSAKTNIGHLEAAAGMAGFIKTVLSLCNRSIPASLHFETPNPHIDFDSLRLRVASERTPWPRRNRPGLAGVSAFGFGGTNCHVVLQETGTGGSHLVPLSASDEDGLRAAATELLAACGRSGATMPALRSDAVARGVGERRRLAITAEDHADLARRLTAHLDGHPLPGTVAGLVEADRGKPVFLFAGQGSQWLGMGRDLLSEPAFLASLQRCDRAMRSYLDVSVLDVLLADDPAWLEDLRLVQPAIFAVQVALAALWRSWGVHPGAVVGQSLGEIAAAHVAGCLSLEDAVRIVCIRSTIVHGAASGSGTMAVIELPAEQVRRLIATRADEISIAVSSGPAATVISGAADAMQDLSSELGRSGITLRPIQVDYASHSPQMDPLLPELRSALSGVRPHLGVIPFYSTVAGRLLAGNELDADYWCDNLREPVLFAEVVRLLVAEGHREFIDVNPHPLLVHNVTQCLAEAGREGHVLPSARRAEPSRPVLLDSLGHLYCQGQDVNWSRVHSRAGREPGEHRHALDGQGQEPVVLPLSAHTPVALTKGAAELAEVVRTAADLGDIGYTAARRSSHARRLAVVGASRTELADALERAAERPLAPTWKKPSVVFVFPGHGAAWSGMGLELAATEPVFRDALEDCDAAIRRISGFSVLEFLRRESGKADIALIEEVQPALFAMEVALTALWRSWGVEPDAVVGQSMGEIAAAHAAGALSLDDAALVICRRSALLASIRGQGAMALVELGLQEARELVSRWDGRIEIAASNSPSSTLLAGNPEAVEEVLSELERTKVFARRMVVDVAGHSSQVEPLLGELRAGLRGVWPSATSVPFCSSVTGTMRAGEELGTSYWLRNLREPVMFGPAVALLAEQGHQVFLEISPHAVLGPAIDATLHSVGVTATTIARAHKKRGERTGLLEAVAALYTSGCEIDWDRVQPVGGRTVPLPTYPWQRERYWLDRAPAVRREITSAVDDRSYPEPEEVVHQEAAGSADDGAAFEDRLANRVAWVLRLRQDEIQRDVQLSKLGMTSLMAMELRNLVLRDLTVALPVSRVLRADGISALAAEAQALVDTGQTAPGAATVVGAMDLMEL
ncbi:polyketide synthase 12/myxalamid-type polyketide synthase MxaF [Lentzea xinjiangensis]|uniref:Polyketide synthase 12/myxalamid-type polyketide synthase MxaF n=1 Tax=Lentzea xinjiangensis TaxID=402600 RepID=A0A1H9WLJ0_9PSEU|nr:type I polyketide synthase [Lentzea xinjiangensis]SES34691.1 polyketide synthase 12/myxalamid-type polyketide synthase MxaF [Lentzea xinjiangensis]